MEIRVGLFKPTLGLTYINTTGCSLGSSRLLQYARSDIADFTEFGSDRVRSHRDFHVSLPRKNLRGSYSLRKHHANI